VKITYLNRREGEKRFRGVTWGQKLTLNHPSLVNEGEELGFQPTTHKREREMVDKGFEKYLDYLLVTSCH